MLLTSKINLRESREKLLQFKCFADEVECDRIRTELTIFLD